MSNSRHHSNNHPRHDDLRFGHHDNNHRDNHPRHDPLPGNMRPRDSPLDNDNLVLGRTDLDNRVLVPGRTFPGLEVVGMEWADMLVGRSEMTLDMVCLCASASDMELDMVCF